MVNSRSTKEKQARKKIFVTLDAQASSLTLELDQAIRRIRQEIATNFIDAAAHHITQLLEQLPKNHPAPYYLKAAYHSHIHEWELALSSLETISDTRKSAQYFNERAKILLKLRRNKEALSAIKQAIQLEPKNASSHMIAARIFKAIGSTEKTHRFLDRAINLQPDNHQAYIEKLYLPGARLSEKELELCSALANSTESETVRYNLYFALARHYANCADYKQEMMMLDLGNQAKAKTLNNDLSIPQRQQFASILANFEKLAFDDSRLKEPNPTPLIFIVGFPRSGSTLTEQILSAHPHVVAAGESMAIPKALLSENRTDYPDWVATATTSDLSRLKKHIDKQLADLAKSSNESKQKTKFHIVEKSLDNVFYLGLIKLMYPDAKIVHTFKHPIDNCLGCYKQVFSGDAWRYIYSLDSMRDGYKNYHKVMQYWDKLFPSQIYHFSYEALVADQRATTDALLRYCGLDWSESCMNFHSLKNNVETASVWQVRQTLNNKSIGRWRNYQSELTCLLPLNELSQWQPSQAR